MPIPSFSEWSVLESRGWTPDRMEEFVKSMGLVPRDVFTVDDAVECRVGKSTTISYDGGTLVVANEATGAESVYDYPLTKEEMKEVREICLGTAKRGNHDYGVKESSTHQRTKSRANADT